MRCAGFPVSAPVCGGAQRKSFQIAQRLARSGYRVFFGSDDTPETGVVRQLAASGIEHVRVPFRSPGWLSAPECLARVVRIVRHNGINVIHSHDRWTAMFGRCAAALTGAQYFYTAHIVFLNHKATRAFFGRNITAVSESVKNNLRAYFNIDAEHIQTIHNGEDIAAASPEKCLQVLRTYGLEGHRVISCIGRLNAQKGHEFLLHAVAKLKARCPELKCLLVGEGDQREALEWLARELRIGGNVVFCGAQDEVAPFIQVSEMTVLPSISEGLPIAVVESLALGIPVVATRVGGVPEVVLDGENGLIVEPRDAAALAHAIEQLLRNPAGARRMGAAGREWVQSRFSLESMLHSYEEYYRARTGAQLVPEGVS